MNENAVSDFARALGCFSDIKFGVEEPDFEWCPSCQHRMIWLMAERLWACHCGQTATNGYFTTTRRSNG
jgi:ribosomal protein L37AE/L43A